MHLVHTINGDVLYLYGYDNLGKMAFSVNCKDKVQYERIEILDEIFVKIGPYKVMSVYMVKFLNCKNKPLQEIVLGDNSKDEMGERH